MKRWIVWVGVVLAVAVTATAVVGQPAAPKSGGVLKLIHREDYLDFASFVINELKAVASTSPSGRSTPRSGTQW